MHGVTARTEHTLHARINPRDRQPLATELRTSLVCLATRPEGQGSVPQCLNGKCKEPRGDLREDVVRHPV